MFTFCLLNRDFTLKIYKQKRAREGALISPSLKARRGNNNMKVKVSRAWKHYTKCSALLECAACIYPEHHKIKGTASAESPRQFHWPKLSENVHGPRTV